MCISRHTTVWAAMVLSLAVSSAAAVPGACSGKTSSYNGYKVLSVEVKDPIGFITPFGSFTSSLKNQLKLHANDPFSQQNFEDDSALLSAQLKARFASTGQTVKLSFATAEILDCDTDARTLRVVYPVFTTVLPSFIAPSAEEESSESQRPGTTGAVRASEQKLSIAPLMGYNQTRKLWGGLSFSDAVGRLHVQGETQDSTESLSGHLEIIASHGPAGNFLAHAEWAGTFEYQDVPAATARFKEAKITGRFSASTKETAKQHAILRYGISLEGGHQQSDNTVTAQLTPNSGYGSLKLYVGITGRPGRNAFSTSYGFQLGNTFVNGVPTFKKYLLDLSSNLNVPVPFRKPLGDSEDFKGPLSAGVHRSFNLEARVAAGLIQDAAGAPLGERFLGGNTIRPFVQDNSWIILGNPFIRSIPENQLGTVSGTALGGSRFYSGNVTVSYTIWGKPLLPKDLATADSQFPGVLNLPFQTAVTSLANNYQMKDPEFIRITGTLKSKAGELQSKLAAFSNELKQIPEATAALLPIASQLKEIKRNLLSTNAAAGILASNPDPQVAGQLATNTLPALLTLVQKLTASLRDASQNDLANRLDQSMNEISALGTDIHNASNLPTKKYQDQAWETLAPGHRALDVFLHELNIYSISPVGIFDVARVWPVNQGVRYGVGPGLRFSLVNANFTVSYGFNPKRSVTESVGAIFFNLDVTSLF